MLVLMLNDLLLTKKLNESNIFWAFYVVAGIGGRKRGRRVGFAGRDARKD